MDNYKIFIFLFPIFLISCALENNLTPLIRDDLRTSSAYSAYGIRPINLKIQSKCAQAPSVKIRNIEKNTHFYTVIKNQYYIVPSELMCVFRRKPPPDSVSFRHSIPAQAATPGERIDDAG